MKALFKFKSGQETVMDIPEALQIIYLPITKDDKDTTDSVELTPDNIIERGGFTQKNIGSMEFKVAFEFKGSNHSYLYYEEMQ